LSLHHCQLCTFIKVPLFCSFLSSPVNVWMRVMLNSLTLVYTYKTLHVHVKFACFLKFPGEVVFLYKL